MKTKAFALIIAGSLCLPHLPADETAVQRLEQGVALMKKGTLEDALHEFEGVLLAETKSEKLAAEARYHMADCYRKLGDETAARKQLDELVAKYPAGNPWVEKARELFPATPEFGEATWSDNEFLRYEIKSATGQTFGALYTGIRKKDDGNWFSFVTRNGGQLMQSNCVFDASTYRPLKAGSASDIMGDHLLEVARDGSWELSNPHTGASEQTEDPNPGGWSAEPFFENDQVMSLIRLVPDTIGAKTTFPINATLQGGAEMEFIVESVAHETLETTFGKFDCAKFESNIKQTFWIEREGKRRIIRIQAGMVNIDLSGEDTLTDEPIEIRSEKQDTTFALPARCVMFPGVDKEDIFRVQLADPLLRFREGLVELQPTENFQAELRQSTDALVTHLCGNLAKSFEEGKIDEESREQVTVGEDKKGTLLTFTHKQGTHERELSLLASNEGDKTLLLRLQHAPQDRESCRQLLKDMLANTLAE